MTFHYGLTTEQIQAVFAEEIGKAGGTVSDTFDDGARLFTRSILPWTTEVRPEDPVQGGIALKATGQEIRVHPYIFRLVCSNGAIMAQAIQTRHIAIQDMPQEEIIPALRTALQNCSAGETFVSASAEIRSAAEIQADFALNMMPLLSLLSSSSAGARMISRIMDQFFQEEDPSGFGLMNAVTAVARDTPDPELRWQLEEYGGGIPAALISAPVLEGYAARAFPIEERSLQLA